jgi:hypothetical protein
VPGSNVGARAAQLNRSEARAVQTIYEAVGGMQRTAIATIASLICAGCSTYQMSERTIARAERRWNDSSLGSYSFDLRVNAFMFRSPCAERAVITVVVRNARIVSYGTCAAPPEKEAHLASIPALFNLMREAKRDGAPGVKGRFDETYGFPRKIEIVVMRWATDSTFTYYVDNFQRLAE